MTKFMYNGIKQDGILYKAWYNKGHYTPQSGIPQGSITIYAREYKSFPHINELQATNNTEIQTDYFEKDRIVVRPSNKWYEQVETAWQKQEACIAKRASRRTA